ncbi:MAG: phosphatidate cytidylyltransferase [Burkholderiaceae bacterium]|nr:phosphatidate cytidylyltransferase [Burkholderiaceae bacterium]
MLLPRVITALILLGILLPAIFIAPPWAWGAISLAFLAVAAHEWVQLPCQGPAADRAGAGLRSRAPARGWCPRTAAWVLGWAWIGLALAGLAVLLWRREHAWPPGLLIGVTALLAAFWFVAGPLRLQRHESRGGGQALVGVLLLGCWLALYELRLHSTWALVSSMAVVWVADIAAYFVGRAIGRRKLAPSISPGKSWEGAIGGASAVAIIGLTVAWLAASSWPAAADTLPARLLQSGGPLIAALVLLALAALSVVGDLHESLLKRQAGVKDSGWILPGHGGVLDRIDALIPTMPVALLVYEILR